MVEMMPTQGAINGGEKMILIFKDLVLGTIKPGIKFEKDLYSTILDPAKVRLVNTSSELIDFREYSYMTDGENIALQEMYTSDAVRSTYTLMVIETSTIDLLDFTLAMDIYCMHNGALVKLYHPCKNGQTGKAPSPEGYACNKGEMKRQWFAMFTISPTFSDIYPQIGVSQGGTTVTIQGMDFPISESDTPIISVHSGGSEQHLNLESTSSTTLTFQTPPNVVNSTALYSTLDLFISFNRQRFYKVPFTFTQHDPTNVRWGDAISLSQDQAKEFTTFAGEKYSSRLTSNQVVTAAPEPEEDNQKFFIIRPPLPVIQDDLPSSHKSHSGLHDNNFQYSGDVLGLGTKGTNDGFPVICNSTIRLLHARTNRYMSSDFYSIPDSGEQEVGLNGENGVGDTNDNWVVQCEPNTRHGYSWKFDTISDGTSFFHYDQPFHAKRIQWMLDRNNIFWRPSTIIRLFHPNTGKYLSFNHMDATPSFCPLCFRESHKQISATEYANKGSSQRFFVKRQTRVITECYGAKENLVKRWRTWNREIRQGDYVVWRNTTSARCEVTGPHSVKGTDYIMDTRFGKVIEVFSQTSIVQVEEYAERGDLYSDVSRQYTSTPTRIRHLLQLRSVVGPIQTKPEPADNHASIGSIGMVTIPEGMQGNGTTYVPRYWLKAFLDTSKDYMQVRLPN